MSKIAIKQLVDEDFVNFKAPSMFIGFPHCTFKCGRELCQNSELAVARDVFAEPADLVSRYLSNPITEAIVIGGLEPFDDMPELLSLIAEIRNHTSDAIVIYSGYNKDEIENKLAAIRAENIIVKFGRFVPGQKPHYDQTLGIKLASDNQYAERIS